jgi:K+-transporting ATPase A subunit
MHSTDWMQLVSFLGLLTLITKPLGIYLAKVLDAHRKTFLDPVLRPLERLTYALMGVNRHKEDDWKQSTLAMLLFSFFGMVLTYAILRFQHLLPCNPGEIGPLNHKLAFNTAISFTTNTHWQSYAVFSIFLLSQGMARNFKPYNRAKLVEAQKVSVEKKDKVRALIRTRTDPSDLGLFGEPGVNALKLKMALDA